MPQRLTSPFGFTDSIDRSLDVAYPITFYGDTTDQAHASPILINGGNAVELEVQLKPVPAVSVTIPLAHLDPGQAEFVPVLGTPVFDQIEAMGEQVGPSTSQHVISGLASGDYMFSNSADQLEAGMPVHLTERVTDITRASALDLAHVHVLLKSADGAAIPSNAVVYLARRHTTKSVSRTVDAKGQADLDASPGDYYFGAISNQTNYFIGPIVSGSRRLPSNNLHLTLRDKLSVTVTLVTGTHTVKGFARKDGKGLPGAFILLLPSDEIYDDRRFFRQQSDLDGSFFIDGIAPGSYTLLAIDDGWYLEWQKQIVLSHYLDAAMAVQIPDTADKVQTLTTPLTVQSR